MPELCIKITCGKGTYVRSLARDIGESLGSGAYLTALRRTRVGDNKTENAFSIEEFEKNIEDL
jgi:tRNA pseudouridine55 synthase